MRKTDYLLLGLVFGGLAALTAANAVALHFLTRAGWEGSWDGGAMLLALESPMVFLGIMTVQQTKS